VRSYLLILIMLSVDGIVIIVYRFPSRCLNTFLQTQPIHALTDWWWEQAIVKY